MTIESSLNFRSVSEVVTTSGSVSAEALGALGTKGYELVINLLPDSSTYAVAGEAAIITGQGIGYVYIPVDFAAPTHDDFEAFAAAMDATGKKMVHVHCAANYRVSAFYSLYAMSKGRWSAAEAEAHLRGVWNPEEFPAWEAFIAAERALMTP